MGNTTTFKELIQALCNGATEGISATKTLRIVGDQLIHYSTPIAERYCGKVLINNTRYSLATGQLQKQIRNIVPESNETYRDVSEVTRARYRLCSQAEDKTVAEGR